MVYRAVYTFIVLGFAEELVKFIAFKLLLKKKFSAYSWADVVALMVIIGTAFGLIEDIPCCLFYDTKWTRSIVLLVISGCLWQMIKPYFHIYDTLAFYVRIILIKNSSHEKYVYK